MRMKERGIALMGANRYYLLTIISMGRNIGIYDG